MPRRTPLPAIIEGIVSQPTARFAEHRVIASLRQFAADRRLAYSEDPYGNVYVSYQRGRTRRPLALGAHLDHPGFAVTAVRGKRLDLEFRDGLSGAYGKGEVVRIYGNGQARARITSTQTEPGSARFDRWLRGARATLLTGDAAVRVGDLALWDVDVCRVRGLPRNHRHLDPGPGSGSIGAAERRVAESPRATGVVGAHRLRSWLRRSHDSESARGRTYRQTVLPSRRRDTRWHAGDLRVRANNPPATAGHHRGAREGHRLLARSEQRVGECPSSRRDDGLRPAHAEDRKVEAQGIRPSRRGLGAGFRRVAALGTV